RADHEEADRPRPADRHRSEALPRLTRLRFRHRCGVAARPAAPRAAPPPRRRLSGVTGTRDATAPRVMGKLDGRRVAIIAADGFEESELTSPKAELEREGARCDVLSLREGEIRGFRKREWGARVK